MIFSFYPSSKIIYNQIKQPNLHKNLKNIHLSPDKIKDNLQLDPNEKLNWIRKKYKEFQQSNQFNPIASTKITKNRCFTHHNIKLKNKKSLDYINQVDRNNGTRRSEIVHKSQSNNDSHSQSQISQKKKRKSHYSRFFNQTLIDKQHNFVGKNYIKQIQNLRQNSINMIFSPENNNFVVKNVVNRQESTEKIFSILNKQINLVNVKQIMKVNIGNCQKKQQQLFIGFGQDQKMKLSNRYSVQCLNQTLKKQGVSLNTYNQRSDQKHSKTQNLQKFNITKKYRKGSKLSKFLKIKQKKQNPKIQNQSFNAQPLRQNQCLTYKYHQQIELTKLGFSRKYSCLTSPQKSINISFSNQIQRGNKGSSIDLKVKKQRKNTNNQQSIQQQLILVTKRKSSLPVKTKQSEIYTIDQIEPWQIDQCEFTGL